MELAVSALAGLGKAAVGGGKALLTAATGGAGASGALTLLQGGATAASVLGQLAAGRAESESLAMQADAAKLDAQREETAGKRRETALKRELMRALGENDVIYAASGIDISAGVAQNARRSAENRAASELTIDRADQDARIAMHRAKRSSYLRMSRSRRRGALLGALGTGFQFGVNVAERG